MFCDAGNKDFMAEMHLLFDEERLCDVLKHANNTLCSTFDPFTIISILELVILSVLVSSIKGYFLFL